MWNGNSCFGFELESNGRVSLENNVLSNNECRGAWIRGSNSSELINNIITNNHEGGLWITSISSLTLLVRNIISQNGYSGTNWGGGAWLGSMGFNDID